MRKLFIPLIFVLFTLAVSCGKANNKGKEADDSVSIKVTSVIDSIIASESDMNISSLSVIQAPMPSVMADEVQPALKQSADMISSFMLGQVLGGKTNLDEAAMLESFVAVGAPLRKSLKQYESETHPDYVFGLVNLKNAQDSTKTEKRLYIFEKDNLNSVKRTENISNNIKESFRLIVILAYGDQIDFSNKDLKTQDIKPVVEDPILNFIFSD